MPLLSDLVLPLLPPPLTTAICVASCAVTSAVALVVFVAAQGAAIDWSPIFVVALLVDTCTTHAAASVVAPIMISLAVDFLSA